MKHVTKFLTLVLLLALWVLPASAQDNKNVTFQVDMNAALDACQLVPDDGDVVGVSGSFNDWSTPGGELSDDDGDGIYAGTFQIASGEMINYKFWTTNVEYEDNVGAGSGNRNYTVTDDADQEIAVVDFNKAFVDICGALIASYEIEFSVDMSVASIGTRFNPDEDVVVAAGGMNGWSTTADTLVQDFINPNIYSKVITVEDLAVPQTIFYKFVVGKPGEETPQGWESGIKNVMNNDGNREIMLTGEEEDVDENGFLDVKNADVPPYLDDVGPDEIITEDVDITFTVDLRPAFYYFEDNGRMPADTQTGGAVDILTGVWLDGPIIGASSADEDLGLVVADWSQWGGPEGLGAIDSRKLVDDGTNGDAVAGDSIFTIQLSYVAGTARTLPGKFGTDGYDDEANEGVNHIITLDPANPTVNLVFGAMRLSTGKYDDDRGPSSTAGNQVGDYDPYILIDNLASPPTVEVVRSGGEADGTNTSIEVLDDEVPSQISLSSNFPNPFNPSTSFDYTIAETQHVTIRVYDMLGRVVATLVDGLQPASTYRVRFDAPNLASGTYLYRLQTDTAVMSRTMVLLK